MLMCVTFLKYWIDFLVQTSFSLLLVENDHNLFMAKLFFIQLSLKKVFGDLRFNLFLCNMYIFFILF